MDSELTQEKLIQLQYQGYCKTPSLWNENSLYGLTPFKTANTPLKAFTYLSNLPQRLGNRVEYFALHQMSQLPHIDILNQNIQIQQEKHTIGELDALLRVNGKPIHLEIVYKFYLHDSSVGSQELDHWISPNRKDSLVKKLDKIKNKQLPLLYRPETQKTSVVSQPRCEKHRTTGAL